MQGIKVDSSGLNNYIFEVKFLKWVLEKKKNSNA